MKQTYTWKEKYLLALKENLTLEDIKVLRSCGMPKAREIRQKAINYCLINDIPIESKKINAQAVFKVTGCNLSYYRDKMNAELMVTTYSER